MGGSGQHVIGQIGGVGEEVLEHHGKEILAAETRHDLARVRRDRHGVAVVDHHGLDGWAEGHIAGVQQRIAHGCHVDQARDGRRHQIRPLQRVSVHHAGEPTRGREQHSAAALAPRARYAGQQCDQSHRITTAGDALHAVVQPDRRGLRVRVHARKFADLLRLESAFRSGALRSPGQGPLAELFPAVHVRLEIRGIRPAVGEDLVHQRERQRPVGARSQRQMQMALLGGFGAARVDADQRGAVALGLLREAPEVQVRGHGIAAPDQDQPRLREIAQMHAQFAAVGGGQRVGARGSADGAVQARGAERVEEAGGDTLALDFPHRARVAVGQDALGTARGDRGKTCCDIRQCRIPADLFPLPAAFGAHALQRMQHAFGVVGALGVATHLGAEHAGGGRVVRIAFHAGDTAVLHRDAHGAGVGAVVRAGGADGVRRRGGDGVHGVLPEVSQVSPSVCAGSSRICSDTAFLPLATRCCPTSWKPKPA